MPRSRAGKAARSVDPFITLQDLAERTKMSCWHWRHVAATGALPVYRFGTAVRLLESDVLAYLARCKDQPSSKSIKTSTSEGPRPVVF